MDLESPRSGPQKQVSEVERTCWDGTTCLKGMVSRSGLVGLDPERGHPGRRLGNQADTRLELEQEPSS